MIDYEQELTNKLSELAKRLPSFEDGRINYTDSPEAFVLVAFVRFNNELLIVQRSEKVLNYKGLWGGLGGFIDEPKPVKDKVLEEVSDELGIKKRLIRNIKVFAPVVSKDERINRTWFVYPILVDLTERPEIKLDWEHVDYRWIEPSEIKNFDVTPNTHSLLQAMGLYSSE